MTGHSFVLISSFVFARHVLSPVDTVVVVDVWPFEVVVVVVAAVVVTAVLEEDDVVEADVVVVKVASVVVAVLPSQTQRAGLAVLHGHH